MRGLVSSRIQPATQAHPRRRPTILFYRPKERARAPQTGGLVCGEVLVLQADSTALPEMPGLASPASANAAAVAAAAGTRISSQRRRRQQQPGSGRGALRLAWGRGAARAAWIMGELCRAGLKVAPHPCQLPRCTHYSPGGHSHDQPLATCRVRELCRAGSAARSRPFSAFTCAALAADGPPQTGPQLARRRESNGQHAEPRGR